jgi:hypothetical protein
MIPHRARSLGWDAMESDTPTKAATRAFDRSGNRERRRGRARLGEYDQQSEKLLNTAEGKG